jgi:hypothetical protein
LRALREAELAGHHPDSLLTAAVAVGGSPIRGDAPDSRSAYSRSADSSAVASPAVEDSPGEGSGVGERGAGGRGVGESGSVADVLRWRIRFHTRDRVPEQIVDPQDWTTWSPPVDGPVGQFLHDLAVLASDRQAEIGHTAAAQHPEWATGHLGTPPEDPDDRLEWERRAGTVGAYRELAGIDDTQLSLGAAPSPEHVLHRALWHHATRALGVPAEEVELRGAPDAVLYEHVAAWEHAQAWAPAYVADQLRDAHQVAETSRRDAVLGAAELATATNPAPDAATRVDAVYTAAETADRASVRAGELERVRAARAGWAETVAEVEQRARLAAEELTRRELPPPSSMSQDGQVDRGHDLMSGGSVSTGTRGRVDDADAGHGPGTAVAQPRVLSDVMASREPAKSGRSRAGVTAGGRRVLRPTLTASSSTPATPWPGSGPAPASPPWNGCAGRQWRRCSVGAIADSTTPTPTT